MNFSVLITNYNRAGMVAEAVDSVLAQTRPADEILVVDDGSDDASLEVLRAYGGRIRLIARETNGGMAAALQQGIEAARGQWVCLLDSDDLFLPHKLERLDHWAVRHPRAALLYHRLRTVDAEGRVTGNGFPGVFYRGRVPAVRAVRRGPMGATSGQAYRRDFLLRHLPAYPRWRVQRYAGESYFCQLALCLEEVCGIPEILGSYRIHSANHSGGLWGSIRREKISEHLGAYDLQLEVLNLRLRECGYPLEVTNRYHWDFRRLRWLAGLETDRVALCRDILTGMRMNSLRERARALHDVLFDRKPPVE
jgi:glycosyltransferase involved in cell wall biosynthesis